MNVTVIQQTVHQCGNCNAAYLSEALAEKCCVCTQCGEPVKPRVDCVPCSNRRETERWAERFAAAETVTEADCGDAMFWSPELDRYFSDTDEMLDHCVGDGIDAPAEVFCTRPRVYRIDLPGIFEHIEENLTTEDGPVEGVRGDVELQAAVDTFNKLNENVRVWYFDTSRKIILDPAEVATVMVEGNEPETTKCQQSKK